MGGRELLSLIAISSALASGFTAPASFQKPRIDLTDSSYFDDGANIGAGDDTPGGGGDGIIDAPELSEEGPGGEGDGPAAPRDCVSEGGVVSGDGCLMQNQAPDPGTPEVRISDLISFRPTKPAHTTQPDGWAVAGLPANFVSKAGSETLTGTLLGLPVTIRFTPIAWEWEFGDGEDREASTGGASWAELGVPEFSNTATSHIYRARGTFTAILTVRYAAEYQFAGRPWRTISGTLPVEADPVTIVSAKPKPVLVEDDCIANPSGPGC